MTGLARVERSTDVLMRITQAPEAYKHLDARDGGWTKVVLKPAMSRV